MRVSTRWLLLCVTAVVLGVGVTACTTESDSADDPPTSLAPTSSPPDPVALAEQSVVSVQARQSAGSGVVLTADGYILTGSSVVTGSDLVTVTFSGGESGEATVVGADPRTDLAVLKVDGASELTPVVFGDSGGVQPGDEVQLVDAPAAQEIVEAGVVRDPRSTVGALSMIETDLAAGIGTLGRPVINTAGEVIAINMAASTTTDGRVLASFAVPSSIAMRVADQLIAGQPATHPYLGVEVDAAPGGGALVQRVAAGSPAEQAGLQPADVITGVGDRPVEDADDVLAFVMSSDLGDEVTVTYARDGSDQTTTVTLGQSPAG